MCGHPVTLRGIIAAHGDEVRAVEASEALFKKRDGVTSRAKAEVGMEMTTLT